MDEIGVIEALRDFVDGNTLILLYFAVSITRYILAPLYKGGETLKNLVSAATSMLQTSENNHKAIAFELKRLNATFQEFLKKMVP